MSPWSKYRYKSGLLHVLSQAAEDGHCFLPQPELMKLGAEILSNGGHQAEIEAISDIIDEMGQQQALMVEKGEGGMPLCYKPAFFYTEENLAQLLRQQLSQPVEVDLPRVRNWIERFTESRGISLSPQQHEAVEMAVSSRIMVLTGGPGTGKTFCTRTIVALWKVHLKIIQKFRPDCYGGRDVLHVTMPVCQNCLSEVIPGSIIEGFDDAHYCPKCRIWTKEVLEPEPA